MKDDASDLHEILEGARGLEDLLRRLTALTNQGRHAEAIRLGLEEGRNYRGCPGLLLALATAAQLGDGQEPDYPSLQDIEGLLQTAMTLESGGNAAALELAEFLDAVKDDTSTALLVLENAISQRTKELEGLYASRIRILGELGRTHDARAVLEEARRRLPEGTAWM